jgi:hypothetical protein
VLSRGRGWSLTLLTTNLESSNRSTMPDYALLPPVSGALYNLAGS